MNTRKLIRAGGKLAAIIVIGGITLAVICGGLAIGFLVDESGFVITAIALTGTIGGLAAYHRRNEEQIAIRRYEAERSTSQRRPGVSA